MQVPHPGHFWAVSATNSKSVMVLFTLAQQFSAIVALSGNVFKAHFN
jgi:hypothetical protein